MMNNVKYFVYGIIIAEHHISENPVTTTDIYKRVEPRITCGLGINFGFDDLNNILDELDAENKIAIEMLEDCNDYQVYPLM